MRKSPSEIIHQITDSDSNTEFEFKKGTIGSILGKSILKVCLSHDIIINIREALAWGIIGELYISHVLTGYPIERMRLFQYEIKESIGSIGIKCHWYNEIIDLCIQENNSTFSLIGADEKYIQQMVSRDIILETLDFCRESLN
jgi:3-dehydroquinate synthase